MSNNVKGNVLVVQSIDSSLANDGVPATFGATYDEWPGSSGNAVVRASPGTIQSNDTTGAALSVSLTAPYFSIGLTEPIWDAQSGYLWPHGSQQPAFGAFWRAQSDNDTGVGPQPGDSVSVQSANEVRIGSGQSDLGVVVQCYQASAGNAP